MKQPICRGCSFCKAGPASAHRDRRSCRAGSERATQEYRVLLLDQRGTERSTPVLAQTLARLVTPQAQANYLRHFRSDAIVRDAELIRRELAGEDTPWSVLGQSYGGFCAVHYLSAAPHGLHEVLITGGLPPLNTPADAIYRATYRRVLDKNRHYYERYPSDTARARLRSPITWQAMR